jgi:hypothetical protein
LKVLNFGLSLEDLLFIFNGNYNQMMIYFLSNQFRLSFMDNEEQNNSMTESNKSQPKSSQPYFNISNSNKDRAIEIDKMMITENNTSDNEFQDEIVNNINHKIPNFNNFNLELSLEEKYNYLKLKFYNKGIDPNLPYLDWFNHLLIKTDGNKNNIDNIIENNLNHILKIERETQLNNCAFFRNKPFLMNKIDNSPLAIPSIIPVLKRLTEEENFDENRKNV